MLYSESMKHEEHETYEMYLMCHETLQIWLNPNVNSIIHHDAVHIAAQQLNAPAPASGASLNSCK